MRGKATRILIASDGGGLSDLVLRIVERAGCQCNRIDWNSLQSLPEGCNLLLIAVPNLQNSDRQKAQRLANSCGTPSLVFLVQQVETEQAVAVVKAGCDLLIGRQIQSELPGIIEKFQPGRNESTGPARSVMQTTRSAAMKESLRTLHAVAATDAAVLIQGETGCGKERAARIIHQASNRSQGSFIPVDCTSIPDTLLESSLFGHEKGAFTGAVRSKPGMLEMAEGGTLFLDEIGELPMQLQAKLLRVLQERSFYRLGGTREIRVDFRLLAATNRNLDEAVHNGQFREDLYYRLKVIAIEIPPLRQRTEDIPDLAREFVTNFARRHNMNVFGIHPEAMQVLIEYNWPGNIRQLENAIERAVVLTGGDIITTVDLPQEMLPGADIDSCRAERRNGWSTLKDYREERLKEIEAEYALGVLEHTGGNVCAAAKIAGVSARSFYRLLQRCGINTGEVERIRHESKTSDVTGDSVVRLHKGFISKELTRKAI